MFDHFPVDLNEWKNMYFVEGYFEIPEFQATGEIINDVVLDGDNLEVYNGLIKSSMINSYLVPKLSERTSKLLDDIFIARRYFTKKDRQRSRTKMVVDLLQAGVQSSKVPLIEKDEYEVLDASVIEGDISLIRQFYMSL